MLFIANLNLPGGNPMRGIKLLTVLMAIVFGLNITACCGGGGKTTVDQKQIVNQPTVGQQLEDLEKAYKNGAITKEEYEQLRKTIMDKAASTK